MTTQWKTFCILQLQPHTLLKLLGTWICCTWWKLFLTDTQSTLIACYSHTYMVTEIVSTEIPATDWTSAYLDNKKEVCSTFCEFVHAYISVTLSISYHVTLSSVQQKGKYVSQGGTKDSLPTWNRSKPQRVVLHTYSVMLEQSITFLYLSMSPTCTHQSFVPQL